MDHLRNGALMRPDLAALLAVQHGLVTRAQALARGYTPQELRTLTSPRGRLMAVRRGVYVERSLWETADAARRYSWTVRAALMTTAGPAVASHASAAALLGVPLRPHWCDLVHLTRTGVYRGRTESGIKHHVAEFEEDDVVVLDGAPVLSEARTALDIGREFGFTDGVVACDAALRRGVTRGQLEAQAARIQGWPRSSQARAAVEIADPGAENVAETLLRLLVLELGLGRPETQFEVVAGGRRAFVDLRLRRHFFEFDGAIKYRAESAGGVASRPAEEVVWREKQREDWLRGQGYGVSRVVWKELFLPFREQTKTRLPQDVLRSDRLYGAA